MIEMKQILPLTALILLAATLAFGQGSVGSVGPSPHPRTIDADSVRMDTLGAPEFRSAQQLNNIFHSAGFVRGSAFIDTLEPVTFNVGIFVPSGSGLLRKVADDTGKLYLFTWSDTIVTIAEDSTTFIGIEYDGTLDNGHVFITNNAADFNNQTNFTLRTIINEADVLHIEASPHTVSDHARLAIERLEGVNQIQRDSKVGGLKVDETGTRNITQSTGVLWDKLNKFTISAFNSSVSDDFDRYYRDGSGGFTKETAQTQWNNTQYDDGSGTLVTLANNKWAVQWFYNETDDDVVSMYGTNTYNSSAEAELEAPPASLPSRLAIHGFLVARLVFQKDAATAISIIATYETTLPAAQASDHGSLGGLPDDDHTQYGELSQAEVIAGDWDNTANPWADNEVANSITVDESSDVDTTGTKIAAALTARDVKVDSSGGGTSVQKLANFVLQEGLNIDIVIDGDTATVSLADIVKYSNIEIFHAIFQQNRNSTFNIEKGFAPNNDVFLQLPTNVRGTTYDDSNMVVHPAYIYKPTGHFGVPGLNHGMAYTPLPQDPANENPHMTFSFDGIVFDTVIDGNNIRSPLWDTLSVPNAPTHLSDPDIFYDITGDTMWYIFRCSWEEAGDDTTKLLMAYSVDGFTWPLALLNGAGDFPTAFAPDSVVETHTSTDGGDFISPSVIIFNNIYYMFYNNSSRSQYIFRDSAIHPTGPWANVDSMVLIFDTGTVGRQTGDSAYIWHMETLQLNEVIYLLAPARTDSTQGANNDLFIAKSYDKGASWIAKLGPVLARSSTANDSVRWDFGNIYRSSGAVRESGAGTVIDLYYSANGTKTNEWHTGFTTIQFDHTVPDQIFFQMVFDDVPNLEKDSVPVLHVEPEWAPNGITMISLGIKSDQSVTDDVVFWTWTDIDPEAASTTEAIFDTVSLVSAREQTNDSLSFTTSGPVIASGSMLAAINLSGISAGTQLTIFGTFQINDR